MTGGGLSASLHVIHSADAEAQGLVYPLDEGETTFGRETDNTVVVTSEQASRHHARLVPVPGGHALQDLGSTNGTFVNSKPIQEQRLRHGDVVRVASTVLKYVIED
jgi:pSer/pThr/pTyr-binding forkhead associated (FHA) protein